MNKIASRPIDRRHFLKLGLVLPVPLIVAACGGKAGEGAGPIPTATAGRSALSPPVSTSVPASGQAPAATAPAATSAIACSGVATPVQTEGPYFKAGAPQRASLLENGISGTRLSLSGFVVTRGCKPVAGTRVDFWQADAGGNYDNSGYRLRGYQMTDAQGRYQLETVIPGLYPGRTEHIHVKVQAPNRPVLTTQLYFPGVTQNRSDGIFDQALLIDLKDGSGGAKRGSFNFVLDMA